MADRYLITGGTGNWNSTTNWSTTSGGASGASFPVSTDDVIIDVNSFNTNLTINVASVCLSLSAVNYTGNIGFASTLNVYTDVTYSSGMTTSGSGTLTIGNVGFSTSAINFNGVTQTATLAFNNGTAALTTYTLTGDLNVTGAFTLANGNLGGAGTKMIVNGGDVRFANGFSIFTNGNRWVNGTSTFRFVGSGTGNFTSGVNSYITNPISFEKTGGTINMTSGALYSRNTVITYVSGTFTNFILAIQVGTCVLNTAGMNWSTMTISGSGTLTNNSLCTVINTFTNSISSTIGGAFGINCGNLTTTANLLFPTGSTTNISGTLTSTGTAASPITIGTVTSGLRANMILNYNGNQDVSHTNGRDIDSDGGLTIMSYKAASISNCDNWTTLPIITSINKNIILR